MGMYESKLDTPMKPWIVMSDPESSGTFKAKVQVKVFGLVGYEVL